MKKHKLIIIAILAMTAMLAFTCACGVGNDVKDNQISGETSLPSNSENSSGNGESSDSESSTDNGESSDSESSTGN